MEWVKIVDSPDDLRSKFGHGKPQLLKVRGTRICLAQIDERFYAVHDKCTHSGESLSKGHINYIGEVVCPWHGYRFSMKNGQCQGDAADLETYPVKENDNGVFIGL
jgi:nitrite reductase/ring-hydroxylating ferredoxin subunit